MLPSFVFVITVQLNNRLKSLYSYRVVMAVSLRDADAVDTMS